MLKSSVCRQEDIESKLFADTENELKTRSWFELHGMPNPLNIIHRKSWEFSYITIALRERGMLQPGKKGIGFAVGCEPLPSYFASQGCEILATDLYDDSENVKLWARTGQNAAGNIMKLNELGHCTDEIFRQRVSCRNLDMNHIPEDIYGKFDFCWSSCAIEHVGSLEKSMTFLKNVLNVLKPGGISVHTTEYNLSSEERTYTEGNSVLYRKKDLIMIAEWMREHGHQIEELDLRTGDKEGDMFIDSFPYYAPPAKYHIRLHQICAKYRWQRGFLKIMNHVLNKCGIKLKNLGFIGTSAGIIVRKGS